MAITIFDPVPSAQPRRRDFLKKAASSSGAFGLFGGAPLVLLPRKAAAQSTGLDSTVMANLAAAAVVMYQGYTTQRPFTSASLLSVSNAVFSFSAELTAVGGESLLQTYAVAPVVARARAVPAFDQSLQAKIFSGIQYVAASVPAFATIPYDFLSLEPQVQPAAAAQIAAMAAPAGSIHTSLQQIGNLIVQMSIPYRPNQKPGPTLGQAGLGIAAGTAAIGAGGVLVAGGTALGTGSAIASGLLIGSGVGLAVVGILVVGYFAYAYFAGGGGGGQSDPPQCGDQPCPSQPPPQRPQ